MPSSIHYLSLHTKLMTVLNKENWQSTKNVSRRHLSLYAKLITVLNKEDLHSTK